MAEEVTGRDGLKSSGEGRPRVWGGRSLPYGLILPQLPKPYWVALTKLRDRLGVNGQSRRDQMKDTLCVLVALACQVHNRKGGPQHLVAIAERIHQDPDESPLLVLDPQPVVVAEANVSRETGDPAIPGS